MHPANLDLLIYKGVTFGPVVLTAVDVNGNIVDLTGWQAFAKARQGSQVKLDLQPVITNPTGGQITLSFTQAQTNPLTAGINDWDLILQNPTGQRLGPYITGNLTIQQPVTPYP